MKRSLLFALSLLLILALLSACGGREAPAEDAASSGENGDTEQTKPLAVGDSYTFGIYEQDGNTANGKEPIRWTVLAMEEGRMLLCSERVLFAMPYHTSESGVTWESASLRTYLNGGFLTAAFSDTERARLLSVTLANPDNPKQGTEGGRDTEDSVFLLSYAEAEKYLTAPAHLRALPTAYAVSQDVWVTDTGYAPSWLRSSGGTADRAMILHEDGVGAFGEYADSVSVGVRPAVWITYQK